MTRTVLYVHVYIYMCIYNTYTYTYYVCIYMYICMYIYTHSIKFNRFVSAPALHRYSFTVYNLSCIVYIYT